MNWKRSLGKNAPLFLAITATIGVVATVVSAVKATPKALYLIDEADYEKNWDQPVLDEESIPLTKTEIVKATWKCYVPTAILGLSAIACIFGGTILSRRQQAAIASAYAVLAQSYSQYKDKVRGLYGNEDANEIEQQIAFEKQTKKVWRETHPGELMHWYDEFSDRFFDASEEDVLRAEYDTNRTYALDHEVNLNTFYELLGMDDTDRGTEVGWSLEASDFFYGYEWIDFHHDLCTKDDGTEYYKISMPYPPTADYISDTPPDC